MDKAKLLALIAALYLLEIKERVEHVKKTAKESDVSEGDLFKALKEAGYDPKAAKGTAAPADIPPPPPGSNNNSTGGKKQTVVLRHKTEYPKYRRAGLVLTQKAESYEVTEEQLAALKKDRWVVVEKEEPVKK